MLDGVQADHEPLIVTRSNGNHAVVMSLEDFNAYQETLYLTASDENARWLKQSIEQIKSGKGRSVTMEELEAMAK